MRHPIEELAVAVVLSLFLDYEAIWNIESNPNRIRDMRYNRENGRPLKHQRRRPNRRSRMARKRAFDRWVEKSRRIITMNVMTWGADLADELGITSKDNWIRKANEIRKKRNG